MVEFVLVVRPDVEIVKIIILILARACERIIRITNFDFDFGPTVGNGLLKGVIIRLY